MEHPTLRGEANTADKGGREVTKDKRGQIYGDARKFDFMYFVLLFACINTFISAVHSIH